MPVAGHAAFPWSVPPIGMGTGYLVFAPDGWVSRSGFVWPVPAGASTRKFRAGSGAAQLPTLTTGRQNAVDLTRGHGPSTSVACELCAGVAGTKVVKLLLGRGPIRSVPWITNSTPTMANSCAAACPAATATRCSRSSCALPTDSASVCPRHAPIASPRPDSAIEAILEKARWTPSGDRSQPWQFEIDGDNRIIVHVAAASGVYDYAGGTLELLAVGFRLELSGLLEASKDDCELDRSRQCGRPA